MEDKLYRHVKFEDSRPTFSLLFHLILVNFDKLLSKHVWPLSFSLFLKFKLSLFSNDYETSYTTYINHARWHRYVSNFSLEI